MGLTASVIEVTLESSLKHMEMVEEIARRVSKTAGFGSEEEFQIELAVHETVINAIAHGNKEDPSKIVWLQFRIFDDRLEIHVRDQGEGFDLSKVPDPLAEENLLHISGRGMFLIQQFMDEMHVVRNCGVGTEVIMTKKRKPQAKSHQGGKDREPEGHRTTS
jgi:serine/threonine-protein kinase RsbW